MDCKAGSDNLDLSRHVTASATSYQYCGRMRDLDDRNNLSFTKNSLRLIKCPVMIHHDKHGCQWSSWQRCRFRSLIIISYDFRVKNRSEVESAFLIKAPLDIASFQCLRTRHTWLVHQSRYYIQYNVSRIYKNHYGSWSTYLFLMMR